MADMLNEAILQRAAQPQVVYVVPQAQPSQPLSASDTYVQLIALINAGAKYCPIDLAIFPWNLSTCPTHQASLRTVKSIAQEKGLVPPDQPSVSDASERSPQATPTRFCPIGGEVYPATIKFCPNHGVELRDKQ